MFPAKSLAVFLSDILPCFLRQAYQSKISLRILFGQLTKQQFFFAIWQFSFLSVKNHD